MELNKKIIYWHYNFETGQLYTIMSKTLEERVKELSDLVQEMKKRIIFLENIVDECEKDKSDPEDFDFIDDDEFESEPSLKRPRDDKRKIL